MTLLPGFSCFARRVTSPCYEFAIGGWLDLTERDFHPLNVAPFLGAPRIQVTFINGIFEIALFVLILRQYIV